jgi:protein-S-isoprenylcysteine O-methyltransferase Ste14
MATELTFRLAFIACWLIFFVAVIPLRLKARAPAAAAPRQPMNRGRLAALIAFAPLWFAGVLLYPFYPSAIAPLSLPLPAWLRFAMIAPIVAAIPFIVWSHLALGRNWVHALDPATFLARKDLALATSGPYRYVRNPIYLGSFIFIIALALLAANGLLLAPALVLVMIIYRQIPNEEAMLLRRFGESYRRYCERTPRLMPRIW